MKKLILLGVLTIGAVFMNKAQAQEIADNALGLRLGGANGYGAEISYQRAVGSYDNRLEFDLGWRNDSHYDAYKLVGLYQWVWNIESGFNWYAGAGAGVGSVSDDRDSRYYNDGAFLLVAGDIGVEYNFEIPLVISLDLRPEIGFNDYEAIHDFAPDIAVGVRYQF